VINPVKVSNPAQACECRQNRRKKVFNCGCFTFVQRCFTFQKL